MNPGRMSLCLQWLFCCLSMYLLQVLFPTYTYFFLVWEIIGTVEKHIIKPFFFFWPNASYKLVAGAHLNLYSCCSAVCTSSYGVRQHWNRCIDLGEHQLPFGIFSWISSRVSNHAQSFNQILKMLVNSDQFLSYKCFMCFMHFWRFYFHGFWLNFLPL